MERHPRVREPGPSGARRSDHGLRAVPPTFPEPPRLPRPHWMFLYVGVGLAAGAGLALSFAAAPGVWRTMAGAATLVTLFGTMFAWVRMNRLALSDQSRGLRPIDWPLVKEVVLSSGRPERRRSRADARRGKVVRLAPNEVDVLPYDFD